MDFSNSLLNWYLQNKRSLPWRNTKNPYEIWLSEIILQQTKVAQGLPYYELFISTFPTVFDLANAPEEKVLKLWQGLGYYSRARNLHFTAKYIVDEFNGVFPSNFHDLLKLKGVGEYTAAAIASFAYDEPVAVVDGNVFRVLSRFFAIELDISELKTKKESVFASDITQRALKDCIRKRPYSLYGAMPRMTRILLKIFGNRISSRIVQRYMFREMEKQHLS
jgi:A/G-specific adenine glycosylase